MTSRSVDVGNRGVDNCGLRGATNLRQIGQKTGEVLPRYDKLPPVIESFAVYTYQETAIEGLTTLPLDSVVGGPPLGGVCSPTGLSLSSRGGGNRKRVGISVRIRERVRNLGGRQGRRWVSGRRSRSTIRWAKRDLKRHCHGEKPRLGVVRREDW